MRMHLYKEHLGGMLSPPSGESLEKLPPFVRHEFSIKKAKTDIVISGLGWITIQHPDVVVAVHAPRGVDVVLTTFINLRRDVIMKKWYAVIGDPIAQSMSPNMHEAWFDE